MKLLDCPLIGPRPVAEFSYGGEVRLPPPEDSPAEAWSDYVFNRSGAPGVRREWWYHRPSGRWFVLERDTVRDEVVRAVPIEEVRRELAAR